MSDQNSSGNRWEPQGNTQPLQAQGDQTGRAEAPATEAAVGTAVLPPSGETTTPQPGHPLPPRDDRPAWTAWRSRPRRPWVLGIAAAVLALVLGVGGFVVGRMTAPDDRGFDGDGRPGFGPGQGQGQGFDRDGDGQGFPPQPGSGTDPQSEGDSADTTLYVVRSAG